VFGRDDRNCKICTPDEKNRECKNYFPMTLWTFYAKKADNEQ